MRHREFIIFSLILVISLFMTIHNNNLNVINKRNLQSNQYRLTQENNLIEDGALIRLSNGVVLRKSADLIIIEQSDKTIIMNSLDAPQVVAFLSQQ